MSQVATNFSILKDFQDHLIAVEGLAPLTAETYIRQLKKLFHFIGEDYSSASETDLKDCLKHLHEKNPMSPSTQHNVIGAWRKFFAYLKKQGIREDNPATSLERAKLNKRLPKWVPEEDMKKLLSACAGEEPTDLRLRAIVYLLYASGMRISELTNLRMADAVHREDGLLRVTGKGSKTRVVPIGTASEQALENYLSSGRVHLNPNGSDFVFPSPKYKNKPLTRQRMFQMIKELGESVDVKISAHMFRHTCATHMLEHGADLASIQTLLGHSELKTTEIYTDVLDETLRKAMDNHGVSFSDNGE